MKSGNKFGSIISILLGLLIFILIIVWSIGQFCDGYLLDQEFYVDNIVTERYIDEVFVNIENQLQEKCYNIEVPINKVMESLNRDEIYFESKMYIRSLFVYFTEGTEIVYPEYNNDETNQIIETELRQFARIIGIKPPEKDIKAVTERYNNIISACIASMDSFTLMSIPVDYGKIELIRKFAGYAQKSIYLAMIFSCLVILINKDKPGRAIYLGIVPGWLALITLYIPFVCIKMQNYLEKLRLADSSLKTVVSGIVRSFVDVPAADLALVLSLLTPVVFLGLIFVTVKETKMK